MEEIETITLENEVDLSKLKADIPETPDIIQKYLDLKEKEDAQPLEVIGRFFTVRVKKGTADDVMDCGPIMLKRITVETNQLIIERDGEVAYRANAKRLKSGDYHGSIDHKLRYPILLEESTDQILYAVETGSGEIKVYSFEEGDDEPCLEQSFNLSHQFACQSQFKRYKGHLNNPESFMEEVTRWARRIYRHPLSVANVNTGSFDLNKDDFSITYLGSNCFEDDADIAVLLLTERVSPYSFKDIPERRREMYKYRLCVWVRGKCLAFTPYFDGEDRFFINEIHMGTRFLEKEESHLFIEVAIAHQKYDEIDWRHNLKLKVSWNEDETVSV